MTPADIIDHMATLEWFAAPPAAPASQWMPIETAPKDSLYEDGENRYGRRILVWGNGYDEPMRARWWFRIDSNRQNFISDAGFAVFPTHWMPLPAAPDHLRDVAEKAAPAACAAVEDDMSDIVERLRDDERSEWAICNEAADEIERLRAEVEGLREWLK